MTWSLRALGLSTLVVAAGALIGCNTTENKSAYDSYGHETSWEPPRERVAKPAEPAKPAPAPVAAKPAPAPAPRADCMAFPTGNRATSVVELCRNMPAEVVVGQEFCYDIVVTNLTDMTLKEVMVTDACGQNFKMSKSTPEATGFPNMVWKLGDLEPRASRTIKVCGTAQGAGAVTSCATVTYNSLLCATANVVQPALKLACSAPAEALLCDGYTVKFVVTNTGSGSAANAKVKAELPAGLTTVDGKSSVELAAGTLGAGQSREFAVLTKASKTGSYAVKGSASADGGLTASSDGCSTAIKQAVLGVKMTGASRSFLGRNFTWDVVVNNSGDTTANACDLETTLPANAKFVSATQGGTVVGNVVKWNVGAIPAGGSKSFQVTLTAAGDGAAKGVSTIKCACSTPATANAETALSGIPAILVETVDDPDPIVIGDATTYTISVTNQGSATDTNVKVVCTLPEGLEFVSAGGATPGVASGKSITFSPVASLAPKARVTFTVRAKSIKATGDSRFKTSVTSDYAKNAIEEIESTNLYE